MGRCEVCEEYESDYVLTASETHEELRVCGIDAGYGLGKLLDHARTVTARRANKAATK